MYTAIFTLKKMLEEAKIPFSFNSDYGYQIRLSKDVDAVQCFGSYGGNSDKIEIMGALTVGESECDSVKGWLTAEEVFKRFKYCYENNTSVYKDESVCNPEEPTTATLPDPTVTAVLRQLIADKTKEIEIDGYRITFKKIKKEKP